MKNFAKISFVKRELNKATSNTIGNRFESQMNYRKDHYDYNRLYYSLLDHKLSKEEKQDVKKEEVK